MFCFSRLIRMGDIKTDRRTKMASADFVTTINWPVNPATQKIEPYRFEVPGTLPKPAIRSPKYVDFATMSALKKSGSALAEGGSGQLGSTKGLVTADLKIRFDNPQGQWKVKPVKDPAKGPVEFTFQGGKVHIELDLAIYVLKEFMPKRGDRISEKVFAVIYGHELLHVGDYLEMIGKWFLAELKKETYTNKFLVQGKPFVMGQPQDSSQQLIGKFPAEITKMITEEALYVWTNERNRRQQIRDSPAEYRKVGEKISDIMSGANIPRR